MKRSEGPCRKWKELLFVGVWSGLAALGAGCGRHAPGEEAAPSAQSPTLVRAVTISTAAAANIQLQVATAQRANLGRRLTLAGTLDADRDRPLINVASPAAGTVQAITVEVGDPVQKGQCLVRVGASPVRAPLFGTVAAIAIHNGDTVQPGQSIVSLLDLSDLVAYLDLYQQEDLTQLHSGQSVVLTNPDLPRRTFEGRLASISPQVDPGTGATVIRVSVKNASGLLKPGMAVSGTITLPGTEEGVVIPQEAVVFDSQGGSWIYVQAKAGSYLRQPVEVTFLGGGRLAVQRGLQPGQNYVTVGAQELFSQEFSGQIDTGD